MLAGICSVQSYVISSPGCRSRLASTSTCRCPSCTRGQSGERRRLRQGQARSSTGSRAYLAGGADLCQAAGVARVVDEARRGALARAIEHQVGPEAELIVVDAQALVPATSGRYNRICLAEGSHGSCGWFAARAATHAASRRSATMSRTTSPWYSATTVPAASAALVKRPQPWILEGPTRSLRACSAATLPRPQPGAHHLKDLLYPCCLARRLKCPTNHPPAFPLTLRSAALESWSGGWSCRWPASAARGAVACMPVPTVATAAGARAVPADPRQRGR